MIENRIVKTELIKWREIKTITSPITLNIYLIISILKIAF
jgi:hypothetical protein